MKMILVGGPASGKTTVGAALAQKWSLSFRDTDHWVETHAGRSIAQIFAQGGEAVFREWETQALKALLQQDECVISTGGGMIETAENRMLLSGLEVIYLDVAMQAQLARTLGDTTRPLLRVPDKSLKLKALRERRDPLYRSVAKWVVDANAPLMEIMAEIESKIFNLL